MTLNDYIQGPIWVYSNGRLHAQLENSVDLKVRSFAYLEKGWHYGDGGPSPKDVVSVALRLSSYLRALGLYNIDAFAGDSGEISLSAIYNEHTIDVIAEVNGSVSVIYDKNDVQQSNDPRMSEAMAYARIAELARGIWRLSAGYTGIALTKETTVLTEWPFGIQGTMVAYQSASVTVSITSGTRPEARYVSTPVRHTSNEVSVPLAILPYIGNLIPHVYLTAAK